MLKEKSISLAGIREGALVEIAARIYGCKVKDLLSWSEKEDGSVVIIAPTGQKFTYSAGEIVQAVPRVAMVDCAGTGAVIRDVGAGGDGVTKADEEMEKVTKEEEEPEGPEEPKEAKETRETGETKVTVVTEVTKEEEEPERPEEPKEARETGKQGKQGKQGKEAEQRHPRLRWVLRRG